MINSHVLFNSFIPCIHKISIRFFLELFRFCLNPKAIVMLTVSIISIKVLHIFLFLYNSNFPDSSVGKASACNCRRPGFDFWGGKIPWRRDRLPTPIFLGFPCGSASKESACNVEDLGSIQESTCNVGDLGLITGLERSPGDPWRKERLPTPVFWPREFHGLFP